VRRKFVCSSILGSFPGLDKEPAEQGVALNRAYCGNRHWVKTPPERFELPTPSLGRRGSFVALSGTVSCLYRRPNRVGGQSIRRRERASILQRGRASTCPQACERAAIGAGHPRKAAPHVSYAAKAASRSWLTPEDGLLPWEPLRVTSHAVAKCDWG
jgi:hypothetical protein